MTSIGIIIVTTFVLIISRLDLEEKRQSMYYDDEDDEKDSLWSSNLFRLGVAVIIVCFGSGIASAVYWRATGGFTKSWSDNRPMEMVVLPNGVKCLIIQSSKPKFKLGMAVRAGTAYEETTGVAELAANVVFGELPSVDKSSITRDISVSQETSMLELIGEDINADRTQTLLNMLASKITDYEEIVKGIPDHAIRRLEANYQALKDESSTKAKAVANHLFPGNGKQLDPFDTAILVKDHKDISGHVARFVKARYTGSNMAIVVESSQDIEESKAMLKRGFSSIPHGCVTKRVAQAAPQFSVKFPDVVKIADEVNVPRVTILLTAPREHHYMIDFVLFLIRKEKQLERLLDKSGLVSSVSVQKYSRNSSVDYVMIDVELRHLHATEDGTINQILGDFRSVFEHLALDVSADVFSDYVQQASQQFHSSDTSNQPSIDSLAELVLNTNEARLSKLFIDNAVPSTTSVSTDELREPISKVFNLVNALIGWSAPFQITTGWTTVSSENVKYSKHKTEPIQSSLKIDLKKKHQQKKPRKIESNKGVVLNEAFSPAIVYQHIADYPDDDKITADVEFITKNAKLSCESRLIAEHILVNKLKDKHADCIILVKENSLRSTLKGHPDEVLKDVKMINSVLRDTQVTDDQLEEAAIAAGYGNRKKAKNTVIQVFNSMLDGECNYSEAFQVTENSKNSALDFLHNLSPVKLRLLVLGRAADEDVKNIVSHLTDGIEIGKIAPTTVEPLKNTTTSIKSNRNELLIAVPIFADSKASGKHKWIGTRLLFKHLKDCFENKMYEDKDVLGAHVNKLHHGGADYVLFTVSTESTKIDSEKSVSYISSCVDSIDQSKAMKHVNLIVQGLNSDFDSLDAEYSNIYGEFESHNDDYDWYRCTGDEAKKFKLADYVQVFKESLERDKVVLDISKS